MIKSNICNTKYVRKIYLLLMVTLIAVFTNASASSQQNDDISSIALVSDVGINEDELYSIQPATMSEKISSQLLSKTTPELLDVYINLKSPRDFRFLLPYVIKFVDVDPSGLVVVASVRKDKLETISNLEEVISIQPVIPPVTYMGKYTTEGDKILLADQIRSTYGINGEGIKIGIISNGVDHLKDSQKTGDLPKTVTVLSNTIGGDEGTAMLEIVYDIAPGSQLYFHDYGKNKIAFNNAVTALANAGCNIICDDVGWLTEPYFEDGIVANHVNNVISSYNILYVTSAGNSATRHFQGMYYSNGNDYMDFGYGASPNTPNLYAQIAKGNSFVAVLQWDDKFGESINDYNMYIYNIKTGSVIASSENVQNGYSDPIETISLYNNGGTVDVGIAVKKKSGEAKILEFYGYNSPMYTNNRVASDSIFGQAAVEGVVSVGAIYAKDDGYNDIESFSSQGPVTMLYPQGTRYKPDICGIDGVSVSGVGFTKPFYGTSAAAPHVAALMGLVWSATPQTSPYTLKSTLYTSAIDLGASGKDSIFGWGRANGMTLAQNLNLQPEPTITPTKTPTKTPTPTPTITVKPTKTPRPRPTIIRPTKTPTKTPTPTPTITVKPTKTPIPRPTIIKPTPRPTIKFPWT